MSSTTFIDGQTVIYSSWLNDVNSWTYSGNSVTGIINGTTLALQTGGLNAVNIDASQNVTIAKLNITGNSTVTGNVVISSGNVNANVSGNVVVSGNVNANVSGSNVNANITGGNVNAAVTGTVTANQGTNPWVVSGNVNANISFTGYYVGLISEGAVWFKTWTLISSDERIKTNIQDIDDDGALQKILSIQPKIYNYIDKFSRGSQLVYGFIAQQIKEIIPEAVSTQTDFILNIYNIFF